MFERAVIIGVGLIGGSLALALKRRGLVNEVIGISRSPDTLAEALRLGVIDQGGTQLEQTHLQGADLIFIATPLGAFSSVFQRLARLQIEPNTLITDGGSAKQHVIGAAHAAFGENLPEGFVPGHPIAGKELSGVAAADADLYEDHRVILTPLPTSAPTAIEQAERMWKGVGACVECMTPTFHDEVFAATSHLPHLLAYLLVDLLNEHPELGNVFKYTAGGFRDFTRIASSDPVMWRDIALYNHAAVSKWLKHYRAELDRMIESVETQDADALYQLFEGAKRARDYHIVNRGRHS